MRIDPTPLLVLWDIDQTLIEVGGVSHDAYEAAFHRTTGRRLEQPWQFNGRTELAAATEVLQTHGFQPEDGLLDTFLELIVGELHNRASEMASAGSVLPGVADALAAVKTIPGVHQSVLTGNLYSLALLKLNIFDLIHHIDMRVGAYGGDAFERTDLPNFALDRTQQHLGRRFDGLETVIIGDTVLDIKAAHAIGAKAIAVATGTVSAAELHAANADVVLPDLSDTEAVLHSITSGRTHAAPQQAESSAV